MAVGYFFLGAADLAAKASFFFWSALLTWTFFWVVFFWLAFGDLSPMCFVFFCGLTGLRHVSFPADSASSQP